MLVIGVILVISIVVVPVMLLFLKRFSRVKIPVYQNFMKSIAEAIEDTSVSHSTYVGYSIINKIQGKYKGRELYCDFFAFRRNMRFDIRMKLNRTVKLPSFSIDAPRPTKNTFIRSLKRNWVIWDSGGFKPMNYNYLEVLEELREACNKLENLRMI